MRPALPLREGQGWFRREGCGRAQPLRSWMGLVESHQVFQPRRHVFGDDGRAVRPSSNAGLIVPELPCKLALSPAEHRKAEQEAMGGHDPDGSCGGEWFILNTRSGFGDGVDRGRVFKMNTSAASRHPVRPGWSVQAARHADDILDQVQLHSVFHAARIGGSDANGTPGSCLSPLYDFLHRRSSNGGRYSHPGI